MIHRISGLKMSEDITESSNIKRFEMSGLEIPYGLSFDGFKTVVMNQLHKIDYKGDKKEMCMLGWVLYLDTVKA